MNIQEYISSGMIESCVLGLASPEENAEFEKLCAQYPEIRTARESFEVLLEKQGMENAIAPPPDLKQKISDAIFNAEKESGEIPVKSLSPVRKTNWLRIAAAACVILLAGSLWLNFSLRKENKDLKASLNNSNERMAQIEADANMIQGNAASKVAVLTGTSVSPQSYATVYWDTASHDVYLLVNNMPKPPSDQQYQLWALLNGEPIDMGVFEITEKPLQVYRMKNAQAAQAFAITMEKKGGNPTPTMDKLYVMGKL